MLKVSNKFLFGLIFVCSFWTLGIIVLALGTVFGAKFGFLWPMGQDLDWVLILKQGIGSLAAEQEFFIDHRNPLSGWFYSLVSPLILNFKYGFHFLHLSTCLALGVSVYMLIYQFCSGRIITFAVIVSSIISIWWFWSNYTQVISIMIFVLTLSVLTVWSFCVYVDGNRKQGIYYGCSIAFWLLGIGTYSIQCGAIIPIFFIAIFRGQTRNIWAGFRDIIPYIFVGVAFAGIWIASANSFFGSSDVMQTTHLQISWSKLIQSALYFIGHPSIFFLLKSVFVNWTNFTIVLMEVFFIVLMFFTVHVTFDWKNSDKEYLIEGALWTLITAIGLAIPTLILEATSSTWLPGTRSMMLYSGFIPMFLISIIVLLMAVFNPNFMRSTFITSSSILGGLVLLLNLEQNSQGIIAMHWQQNLTQGLLPMQKISVEPLHFIVINESGVDHVGAGFSNRFVQDKLNRTPPRWSNQSDPTQLSLRIIPNTTEPAGYIGHWRVTFRPTEVTGALYENSVAVPPGSVRVVKFDGKNVFPINNIKEEDLHGLQAEIKSQ